MAIVEIRVLSGSRQGERFELDCHELRVGTGPGCDFLFDPGADPGAAGRVAQLRLAGDGWTVKSAGSEQVLLNHEPVAGAMRIRAGDVVRLSERGPDFSFNILARPSGLPSAPAVPAGAAPQQPLPAPGPAAAQPSPSSAASVTAPVVAVAVLAVCVVGLLIAWRLLPGRQTAGPVVPAGNPSSPGPAGTKQPDVLGEKPDVFKPGPVQPTPREKPSTADGPKPDAPKPDEPAAKPEAKDPWAAVLAPMRQCVWLLEVEEPKGRGAWPFATGTAVRGDTLLTSASVVAELARFQKQGWKVYARNQALAARQPVKELKVHKGFDKLAGEPAQRIYFDLGLVTVGGKLSKTAAVASESEMADVEQGMPVAAVAIAHEGEAITRFEPLAASLVPGKVFITTVLEQSPASPRLLHVKADLPKNVHGCPVVNGAGHVLGVYAETAVPPPGQEIKDLKLHYVVEARLVGAWLAGQDADSWIAPAVPAGPPAKEPASK